MIDAAISRATICQVPMAWGVGPSDPVPDMGQHLEMKGFFHAATLNGMAVDLQKLDEPASMPQGFTIRKVNNSENLETWCQIMTEVSEFPDFVQTAWLEIYQAMEIIDSPLWHLYLGSLDGTPVATSGLFWVLEWRGSTESLPCRNTGDEGPLRDDPIAAIGRPKPRLSSWCVVFL